MACEHPNRHRIDVGDAGNLWCGSCGSISGPEQKRWWEPRGWERQDKLWDEKDEDKAANLTGRVVNDVNEVCEECRAPLIGESNTGFCSDGCAMKWSTDGAQNGTS